MYYNIDELKEAFSQGQRLKFLFFWGHQPRKDGTLGSSCLSQWYQAPFEVEKVKYKTAEHWMMAEKARLFDDMDNLKQILSTKSPALAKKIGRKVLRFDQEKWDSERFDIVVKGNYHKFTQNNDLKEYLLASHNRILVEASPVDAVWGIGLASDKPDAENPLRWQGLNLLGFALIKTRDLIINNQCE